MAERPTPIHEGGKSYRDPETGKKVSETEAHEIQEAGYEKNVDKAFDMAKGESAFRAMAISMKEAGGDEEFIKELVAKAEGKGVEKGEKYDEWQTQKRALRSKAADQIAEIITNGGMKRGEKFSLDIPENLTDEQKEEIETDIIALFGVKDFDKKMIEFADKPKLRNKVTAETTSGAILEKTWKVKYDENNERIWTSSLEAVAPQKRKHGQRKVRKFFDWLLGNY